jgi:hypothetical protein
MVVTKEPPKMNRRTFFASLLMTRPAQPTSFEVLVLEAFGLGAQTSAVLVHHSAPVARDQFARWLQTHPGSAVRVRRKDGMEIPAKMFRVRMCFGRGLILFERQVQVRERELLSIIA